jgi:hypothetical protein
MFQKSLPADVQVLVHRAVEVAAYELQYWSGCWAYWPEDDPALAREIAEFPTARLCLRSLQDFQRNPGRRSAGGIAESLSHARQVLSALDGEAYCVAQEGSPPLQERWIDVAPALRLCDDALQALRGEGIRVIATSTPPRGGPTRGG